MAPVVAQVALENRDTFAVAKMNIAEGPQTHRKYLVRGHPTYIVFKDGKDVGRIAGVKTKGQLLQNILNAINK
ncbi:thioredoxin [Candidatus Poribacteria bacterium]|nr:MAG: thioredoxin [Candidatus Poribacteria bacterium]